MRSGGSGRGSRPAPSMARMRSRVLRAADCEVAVVADAGEAFGQDVEQPAADELVGMERHDGGLAGGAGGPVQQDVALFVVTDEALGEQRRCAGRSGRGSAGRCGRCRRVGAGRSRFWRVRGRGVGSG